MQLLSRFCLEDKIPKEFYLSINEDYIDNYDSLSNKDICYNTISTR